MIVNVNQRTASIIHVAGFLIPVILTLYGFLMLLKIVQPSQQVDPWTFGIITGGWIVLGTYQLLLASRSKTESALRLAGYHLFTIAYILLIAGFSMPFICIWAVLFLASYEFFSNDGLRLSIVALVGTAVADTIINLGDDRYVITNIISLVATLVVGMIATQVSQAQQVDRQELSRARTDGLRERDRAVTLMNNLTDAVLATDKNGIILVYNAACLNLLDTNAELTNQPIDAVVSVQDSDGKPLKLSKSLRDAKSVVSRDDLSAVISDETIRLSTVFSPIRSTNSNSKSAEGYIVILRDITKQKSLEEERDEFISVVSHELRTPITIAEGTLSNVQLMMSRRDIPHTTLANNVTVAHEQVVFLAKMVNDLSTLSRAERGVADTPEEIDVSQMVHDLYSEYAPQAEAKGLQFNLALDPQPGTVFASPLYLKELLQNFVTNAIKYTKKGDILLRVTKQDDTLEFSVKDSGIGISKSDQERIFDKFWRSEDYRTRETGGTGLGLYVARKLSRKLNTEIHLSSRLNHGSTFRFSLPLK